MSRTRYVYTRGGVPLPEPIEVGEDYADTSGERQPVFTDRYMEGTRATDGTDISSRGKRRAYMQAHGLADADDFKGTWAKAAKEREAFYTGNYDRAGRREDIARALYRSKTGSKR